VVSWPQDFDEFPSGVVDVSGFGPGGMGTKIRPSAVFLDGVRVSPEGLSAGRCRPILNPVKLDGRRSDESGFSPGFILAPQDRREFPAQQGAIPCADAKLQTSRREGAQPQTESG